MFHDGGLGTQIVDLFLSFPGAKRGLTDIFEEGGGATVAAAVGENLRDNRQSAQVSSQKNRFFISLKNPVAYMMTAIHCNGDSPWPHIAL